MAYNSKEYQRPTKHSMFTISFSGVNISVERNGIVERLFVNKIG